MRATVAAAALLAAAAAVAAHAGDDEGHPVEYPHVDGDELFAEGEGEGDCGCSGAVDRTAGLAQGMPAREGAGGEDDAGAGAEPPKAEPLGVSGMMELSGGEFFFGTDRKAPYAADREQPRRKKTVKPFAIDRTEVTNRDFHEFVKATKHKTDAEAFGWSFVFYQLVSKAVDESVTQVVEGTPWWFPVEGADYARPEGIDSDLEGRWDHPVVHVSWTDAVAFCKFHGKRLPSEAEWEFAARGGQSEDKPFWWGEDLHPDGKHMMNIWQGTFPDENTAEDGFNATAPVGSFPPNPYGLYDMQGNVWEWVQDWWDGNRTDRVKRGGSYLCHADYCYRYRLTSRHFNTPDSSAGNMGFRCAKSVA